MSADSPSPRSCRLAVIGHPIGHSLSPRMHAAAFAALGIDGHYDAVDVAPGDLLAWVRETELDGFNVTVPHKESVLGALGAIADDARLVGAVNTVAREAGGELVGHNTDAPGLVAALAAEGVAVGGTRVLVVGAGGTARAAVVGLARAGAARIVVAARRVERAQALLGSVAGALDGHGHGLGLEREATALGAPRGSALGELDLLIHTTPATLRGGVEAAALVEALPWEALAAGAFVLDAVYAPAPTAVVAAARVRGLRASDGREVLVQQGALALERWLGVSAPRAVMRSAVEAALASAR